MIIRCPQDDLQYLVDQITISNLVEGDLEKLELEVEIHPFGAIEADEAGVDSHVSMLPLGSGLVCWAAKVHRVLCDECPVHRRE